MRIASIDVGTNSVRLLLTTYRDGCFQSDVKKITMTRLGLGVNETGLLDYERMKETVEAISAYKLDADVYETQEICIMATSAVRDALNSEVFIQWVKDETGLVVDVISGELEALIGFEGVLSTLDNAGNTLVIDIGGGSAELIIGSNQGVIHAKSYDIGAVRMTGAFVHSDPLSGQDESALIDYVSRVVQSAVREIEGYSFDKVVGIGGTVATFATMDLGAEVYDRSMVQGHVIALDSIVSMNARLSVLTVEERKKIKGLEPKRADIIFAGGIILEKLLKVLEVSSITFSDSDNLEGYILHKMKKNSDTD